MDILKIIKSRRYFHMALRYLLPKQVRLDLKRLSHYVVIDPDEVKADQQLLRMSTIKVKQSINKPADSPADSFNSQSEGENQMTETQLHLRN